MPKKPAKSTAQPNTQPTDQAERPSVIAPNTVITITIPWAEIEPVYHTTLKKLSKQVKSPGFRPGKVPPHLAIDIIGQDNLNQEVLKTILPAQYQAAITKANKKPLTYPDLKAIKVELDQDWVVEAEIAEKPSVNIKDYQKIAKQTKQKLAKEPHDPHHHDHGTHPEDSQGKKPEKTPEQLKAEQDDHTLQHIFQDLVQTINPSIPELLIKEEARGELQQLVRSLEQMQMKLDSYLQRRQITFEQLSGELAAQAVSRLQLEFILQAIIEQANLKAEDPDYQEFFDRIKDPKLREQQQSNQDYRNYVGSLIVRQKVAQHLLNL